MTLFALALLFSVDVDAGGPFRQAEWILVLDEMPDELTADTASTGGENTRLVGSTLALFLGPFGAHRLYLGTTPKVAVIYGLTFGGFGVLVLLDLGHLLLTKDLDPYRNNGRVFMWTAAAAPPP